MAHLALPLNNACPRAANSPLKLPSGAFGVGIAIGTQFPGDIPDTLAGNLATQLLLHNKQPEHRKVVARTLTGAASGQAAAQVMTKIDKLRPHEGFFRNQHYSPYVLVHTLPYFKRN